MASRVAFWFFIYCAFATIAGFVIGGLLGADGSAFPIAAAGARGSDSQEMLIQLVMYPAAPTGIISFALVLWGLRGEPEPSR